MSANNKETAYQRALARGALLDPDVIRERVIGGDAAFGQRVLLTALIKGDETTRAHILAKLQPEYFLPVFGLLFRWVREGLTTEGRVRVSELYERMEAHVYDRWLSASDPAFDESQYSAEEVMIGYLAPIDHVLALEMPDEEMIDKAINSLHKVHDWRLAQKKRRDALTDDTAG